MLGRRLQRQGRMYAGWWVGRIVVIGVVACTGTMEPTPAAEETLWRQDFEAGSYAAAKNSENGWQYELVQPDTISARLEISEARAASGRYALHALVPKRQDGALSSKATIGIKTARDGGALSFGAGETLVFRARYWIEPSIGNVYLLDLEDSLNGNAGVRLYVAPDGTVVLNRDKLAIQPHLLADPAAAKVSFAEWFDFVLEIRVGDANNGSVRAWVNARPALTADAATVIGPVDRYDTVQLGYTVGQEQGELWLDDAEIARR